MFSMCAVKLNTGVAGYHQDPWPSPELFKLHSQDLKKKRAGGKQFINSKRFKFPTDFLMCCEMLHHSRPLSYWGASRAAAADIKDRKTGLRVKKSQIIQWILFEAPGNLPKNTLWRGRISDTWLWCVLSAKQQWENRDWPEQRVLEWVRHLEDKMVRLQCVSVGNSPWGVAIWQQEKSISYYLFPLLTKLYNSTH